MIQRLPALLIVLALSLTGPLHGAISSNYAQTNRVVTVGGVWCPEATSWTGGDISAEPVLEQNGGGSRPRKHLGAPRVEPIVIETGLPLSQPLLDCLADLCANRTRTITLELGTLDHNYKPMGKGLQANAAQLVEARFTSFDAAAKEPARVTLVFAAESTQSRPTGPTVNPSLDATKSKRALRSNFRVTMTGLDGSGIASVDEFAITRKVLSSTIGDARTPGSSVAATTFPDLFLSFGSRATTDWDIWRDSFVTKGNNDNSQEKSGALELLSPDMQSVLFSIQLSGVGICRFSEVARGSGELTQFQAHLYVEGMAVTNGPAPVGSAKLPSATPPPSAARSKAASE